MCEVRVRNKQKVFELSKHIYKSNAENIQGVLAEYFHEDAVWYGPHPFNKLNGLKSITNNYYKPLLISFPDMQKKDVFLMGGSFKEAEGEWVSTMGNLVATFENDFLDIPATKNVVWLRFGEFHKLEKGKIIETRIIVDILDLMRQSGIKIISALGKETFCPAPATMDGIILGKCDDKESAKTLELVETMVYKGLRDDFRANGVYKMGMEYYFHEDLMWYGPGGTGTTRGLKGFLQYHCDPFCEAIPDWEGGNHITRFAEGNYCSFVGWPSIYATHTGNGWLGLPATNKKITMRVMDFYRREDNLLVENWVFIDMVDVLLQIGVDVFDRMKQL